ncbi:ribosomal protein bL36 [Lyticum sinuosum]|uniref:Large ribosomal subunit protein bL36 n=1 Tax=Lyticum sinuosum TaxID=1332059 RepID=A0AAE4VLR5_9RICK|nr:ribosomal protein bL36 [Lyticum sinuosum]MDZ5760963.1 50S ribosomal protein L36 [Lyticum sinuosum]
MKIVSSLKGQRKRAKEGQAQIIRRGKKLILICKSNPRLKARQGS